MPSLALEPISSLSLESDIVPTAAGWKEAPGLETAIKLSLFCDARALDSDELPQGGEGFQADRRGWWGEAFLSDSHAFGSRIWLEERSSLTDATRQRIRDYALEALEWLKSLRIARDVEVDTAIPRRGWLEIIVTVYRETGAPARFVYLWEAF